MPRMKTETFGGGDQSWIGAEAARDTDARTEILDISTFTAGLPERLHPVRAARRQGWRGARALRRH